jgi:hypothetical protein
LYPTAHRFRADGTGSGFEYTIWKDAVMAHEHHEQIAQISKRQDENGIPNISEAEIGREMHLDTSQVTSALYEMEREGHVSRTGEGNWELTPAAASHTTARPDPKEPRQG